MCWAVPPTGTDGHDLVYVAIVLFSAAAASASAGHSHGLLSFVLLRLPPQIINLLLRDHELRSNQQLPSGSPWSTAVR